MNPTLDQVVEHVKRTGEHLTLNDGLGVPVAVLVPWAHYEGLRTGFAQVQKAQTRTKPTRGQRKRRQRERAEAEKYAAQFASRRMRGLA